MSEELEPAKPGITEEARERFLELVRADPYTGIAAAALEAGIPGSRGQRKQLVAADPELQQGIREARGEFLSSKGLGVATLFEKLGKIVSDDGNPSQLRAIQTGLHLHGVATEAPQRIEHTGVDGGPVEVTSPDVTAAIERFTSIVRRAAERHAVAGGDVRDADGERAALPPGDPGA